MADTIDFEELKRRVDRMLKGLPERMGMINELLAESAIPLIVTRLVDMGTDGAGHKMGSYSTNPLPTFFYLGKSTGSGSDEKLKAAVKAKRKKEGKNFKGISYKEFRELNGKPTNFVTLSFTGETLADLGIIQKAVEKDNVIISVGAQGKTTKAKRDASGNVVGNISTADVLDFLAARYGDEILGLNAQEQQILDNAMEIELQKYFDETIGV